MSIERVREYFRKLGIEDRVMEIDESSATVALAAKALGCEEGRIAKTISFSLDGEPILIVTAGDTKIDNAKYKARFGKKAKMLSHEEAAELIGHAVGGVCPFAVNDGVKIYLHSVVHGKRAHSADRVADKLCRFFVREHLRLFAEAGLVFCVVYLRVARRDDEYRLAVERK